MKRVRQGCPLSPILFNLFINEIFNDFSVVLGIPLGESRCCGGLFADDIALCAPSRTKLKKMLKRVNEWAKFNMMNFGINKCATMVIRSDTPLFQNKRDPTFYLSGGTLDLNELHFDSEEQRQLNELLFKGSLSHLFQKIVRLSYYLLGTPNYQT